MYGVPFTVTIIIVIYQIALVVSPAGMIESRCLGVVLFGCVFFVGGGFIVLAGEAGALLP